jgi:ribosomal protein S18 acetylase RimI-like enzyme
MMRMGMGPARRMTVFFKTLGERHNALMPGLHWYLMLLGVDSQYQGQGHAARLVRGMYPVIDAEGLPTYLETETEGNVGMYEHLGFRVLEEVVPPGTGVRMWLMLRDAQR